MVRVLASGCYMVIGPQPSLSPFLTHLILLVFKTGSWSPRDAGEGFGYTGHRVQGVWSIRGRYGVYGLAQCTGPCIPGCVWGAIKWLYGAGGELRLAGGFGEWALYCDLTQHWCWWCPPLSLIPVAALIPGYPSLSPGISAPRHSFLDIQNTKVG